MNGNLCQNSCKRIFAMPSKFFVAGFCQSKTELSPLRTKNNFEKSFELIVEVDETYIGGKPRKENNNLKFTATKLKDTSTTGRGTKKIPVIGVKERGIWRLYARVALSNELLLQSILVV